MPSQKVTGVLNTNQNVTVLNSSYDRARVRYIMVNAGAADVIINLKVDGMHVAPKDILIKVGECFVDEKLTLLRGDGLVIYTNGLINYYTIIVQEE